MKLDPLGNAAHRVPDHVLRLRADNDGERLFLLDEGGAQLTYGQVDDLASRSAAGFRDLGVSANDTVAIFMSNSASLGVTAFGVNRAGAIWSPLSTEYRGQWLRELLFATESKVLVVDRPLLPELLALGDLPFEHIVLNGGLGDERVPGATMHDLASFEAYEPFRDKIDRHHGDTNAVLWTSGTTGRSKGVMQSHAVWMLWSQQHNDRYRDGVYDGERFYNCLPMYNSTGWSIGVFPTLLAGAAIGIDQRFSVSGFWDRIRHYGANHTVSLGTMHLYLWRQPPREDDARNPLRTMVMLPIIPQTMRAFMERFGIQRVTAGYGQSEIMGATNYLSDTNMKPGSCGFTDGEVLVETRVLDDDDRELPASAVGEICVRPRVPYSIFNGYYNEPAKTLETFRNMWHHTGDLGRVDEDGELFFVDRKKDSLRHKGRNTSTFEVEHIARQFSGVQDAAAVGVKTADLEHEEELMVVLLREERAEIDPLEFCKFIDANAPYFFVPRYVQVVDEFPVTPTNKIQKFKLRDRGITANTWDRENGAGDWKPTPPIGKAAKQGVTNA